MSTATALQLVGTIVGGQFGPIGAAIGGTIGPCIGEVAIASQPQAKDGHEPVQRPG